MNLHKDKELFEQIVGMAAEEMNINAAIIEKDYFVTYILKKLVARETSIIFKGGTSLSKCYKLVERFSEDIDLNCDNGADKMTEGMKRKFTQTVIEVIENCGMELYNREEIRSRRDFNKFVINYDSEYAIDSLKPHLIVETAVSIRAFPTEILDADCYIYRFLKKRKLEDMIIQYQLEPFKVKVQALERTFVDKVFAVCDYYLNGNLKEHSRHLYDLYKLYPKVKPDENLSNLIEEVRGVRSKSKMCLSAQSGCSVNSILGEIIEKDFYKKDYEEVTKDLLFEDV
ncbi:MAG: nucleotidyl transferase AbiEii/AbiGii toxin family protein, partial [Clostridiaceae bacterium]|nr:nucleotidyl transferase AbiEii/AbiGii toxin family protein [Clostridiaceae bacterium]